VIVPSAPARDGVTDRGVPSDRVHLLPGAVPPAAFEVPSRDVVEAARARAGIADGVPVVSAVGWIGALKGSDRFLDVAAAVAAKVDGPVRFVWVGGGSDTEQERRFASEITARGLTEVVLLLPSIEDLRPIYAMSNVVLIASREESLSLVALESAAQATPVVAFPGAGGPDVLAAEGIVACAVDDGVDSVANAVLELLFDPHRRAEQGVRACEAVRERHSAARATSILAGVLAGALRSARPSRGGRGVG
jgi:glycosyltransferase involved in cell wall biosynthesis